ncbi:MAG: cysteine desulfurase family protein [Bdellovibrionales bacterium]|jgi:cysteine desulfurase|nr:cysteine desulfurase family protein [Bdellovibrionales bacterium]
MNRDVYLDHAASSPMTETVADFLQETFRRKLGNSSSVHRSGVASSLELEKARQVVADRIGARTDEIYFVSGATEANNLALKGIVDRYKTSKKNKIIISALEHSSVSQVASWLREMGCEIVHAPVDSSGLLSVAKLKELLDERTLLVSIGHVSSEIGVIQNLHEIGELCAQVQAFFHSDGAQAFCKAPVDVKAMRLHLYSMSSHKIHGPRGAGALYVSDQVRIRPQILGGGQEGGLRSGTVPVELIAAMAYASEQFQQVALERLRDLRAELLEGLCHSFPDVRVHGDLKERVGSQLNFALPGVDGKYAMRELDRRGIRVSVGSACDSGKKAPSASLKALGLTDEQAFEALRVSWGLETSSDDIQALLAALEEIRKP